MILLFALTIPISRPLLMALYLVEAATAFYVAARFLGSRSAQRAAVALAIVVLAPAALRFGTGGAPGFHSTVLAVASSLFLLLLACQLFALMVALTLLGARSRSEPS